MHYEFCEAAQERLASYIDGIGAILRNKKRRESFARYFLGLLGEGERKSIEPIAARAAGCPEETRAMTERLLHFVGEAKWEDQPVRDYAARHAIEAMREHGPIEAWIVDDTGFIKQGDKSPGVQRQYTGSAGKTTNCQVVPSLTLCTRAAEVAVDMDLYLPESWAEDRARCRAARIPEDLEFRPKWRMALDMIEQAVKRGYPIALLLADAAYGNVGEFRRGVRELGFEYALDVQSSTRVQIICDDGSTTTIMSVNTVAEVLGGRTFRKITWRQGTRRKLSSRFAAVRVRAVHSDDQLSEEQWLIIERPSARETPTHYVLATFPKTMTRKEMVRRTKQRWRIERTYEDMKGELGLDHFEGRSYPGWQHHVTCVLSCAAFVVAERMRRFPPSQGGSQDPHPLQSAA